MLNRLLKETILTIACSMQDSYCLNRVGDLWRTVQIASQSGNFTNEQLYFSLMKSPCFLPIFSYYYDYLFNISPPPIWPNFRSVYFVIFILNNSFSFSSLLPSYLREIVYNYHMQNTYNVNDWFTTLQLDEFFDDPQEHRKLLESLTYTRLPWLIAQ